VAARTLTPRPLLVFQRPKKKKIREEQRKEEVRRREEERRGNGQGGEAERRGEEGKGSGRRGRWTAPPPRLGFHSGLFSLRDRFSPGSFDHTLNYKFGVLQMVSRAFKIASRLDFYIQDNKNRMTTITRIKDTTSPPCTLEQNLASYTKIMVFMWQIDTWLNAMLWIIMNDELNSMSNDEFEVKERADFKVDSCVEFEVKTIEDFKFEHEDEESSHQDEELSSPRWRTLLT
jgi:hypothetical protein